MESFPSNSQASRKYPVSRSEDQPREEVKVDKMVTGRVVRRKKSLGSRLKETFLGGESNDVFSFVALDIIVPAIKDVIVEAFVQGIERALYGESRSSGRRPSARSSYTNYNRMSSDRHRFGIRDEPRQISRRSREQHQFDDIVLDSRLEGEEVLDALEERLNKYGSASVSDLYDFVGVTSDYTDGRYGWKNLRSAKVVKVRDGYLLDLPQPEVLE